MSATRAPLLSREASAAGGWEELRILGRDPIFRLTVLYLVLYSAFTLIPGIDPVLRETVSVVAADPALILLCIVAFRFGRRGLRHSEQRRFWNLLTGAFSAWLVASLVMAWVEPGQWSAGLDVLADMLFVVFYLLLILATTSGAHLAPGWSRGDPAYRLEEAGTLVFLAGIFVYFVLLPAILAPAVYADWVASYSLFVVLDMVVAGRFAQLAVQCRERSWRWTYSLLALTGVLWALVDAVEGLSLTERLPFMPMGTGWDLIWNIPYLVLIAAARLPHPRTGMADDGLAAPSARIRAGLERLWSPLIAFTFVLPTIHFAFYGLGVLEPELRQAREICVVVVLLVLCSLTLAEMAILLRRTRRLQSDILDARARLQQTQRLESIGKLAGGVAHDFNNLLMVILSYSETALRKTSPGSPVGEDLRHIREAGGRAAALTQQLLAFGRRQTLAPVLCDLNELVGGVGSMLQSAVGSKISVVNDLEAGLPAVRIDRTQFEQVLLNLALNARDAMPRGGELRVVTRRVSASPLVPTDGSVPAAHGVLLEVLDNGSGMDRETLGRIFEPFFTTKEQGQGTGLGLASVYGIVRQSGGDIDATSRPGAGTTFRIFVPSGEIVAD